jgi:hypothetical protein
MDEQDQPKAPSIFKGAFIGYLAAAAVGAVIVVALAGESGAYSEVKVFELLSFLGVLGAFLGYQVTAKWRKAVRVSLPSDEWGQFCWSLRFNVLGVIVLGMSFCISILLGFLRG